MVCGQKVVGSFSAQAADDINPKGDFLDIGLSDRAILGVLCAPTVKEFGRSRLAPGSRAVIEFNVFGPPAFTRRMLCEPTRS